MKIPLKSSGRGTTLPRQSKGLQRVRQTLYGHLLDWRASREMASFFRITESMGLDPMSRSLPGFLQDRVNRVNAMAAQMRQLSNQQP